MLPASLRAQGLSAAVRLSVLFALLFASMTATSTAIASEEAAIAFLEMQQRADGAIVGANDIATAEQSTAAALAVLPAGSPVQEAGLAFLTTPPISHQPTEYLCRIVSTSGVSSEIVTELGSRQNADGGFGTARGAGSNVLDTSYALSALATTSAASAEALAAARYLLDASSGNGWANASGQYDPALSLQAWHALFPYRHELVGIVELLDASLAQFPSPFPEVFLESRRLEAVMLRALESTEYESSVQMLLAQQLSNGSWEGDVYSTAAAMRAFGLFKEGATNPDLATVSGRVVDAEYGAAISNATITAPSRSIVTDANGDFMLANLQSGVVRLEITASGYAPIVADIQLTRDQRLDLGHLPLMASDEVDGSIVRGTVSDAESDLPLQGVRVELPTAGRVATTDAAGQFVFSGLAPETYPVVLTKAGYETANYSVTASAGITQLVSYTMNRSGSGTFAVKGTVSDGESGLPLSGAVIAVSGDASASVVTSEDGSYEISGLPTGTISIAASLSGYITASAGAEVNDGHVLHFSPSLFPSGSSDIPEGAGGVSGRVTDRADGTPLTIANVFLSDLSGQQQVVFTDGLGQFTASVAPGFYTANFFAAGYRSVYRIVEVGSGVTLDLGEILMSPVDYYPPITLFGKVVESVGGTPLSGVSVDVSGEQGGAATVTDGSGNFTLEVPGEQLIDLSVTAEGHKPVQWTSMLPPGSTSFGTLRLRPEGIDELRPDITLALNDAGDRATDPETLVVSGFVRLDVINIGKRPTSVPFDVVAFSDIDHDGEYSPEVDVQLGKVDALQVLDADETRTIDVPLAGSLPFRDAPVHFVADVANAVVELRDDNNITATLDACRIRPDRGSFVPVEKWVWSGNRLVTSTPMVGPLQDTNGDGLVDEHDDPFIVFVGTSRFPDNNYGFVVALNGRTGQEVWRHSTQVHGASHVALGDVDDDGLPEVIALKYWTGMIAINGDGSLKWSSIYPDASLLYNYGAPALGDLDGDGKSEILFSQYVLESDGSLRFKIEAGSRNGRASLIVDMDGDGAQEIVVGGNVFTDQGLPLWGTGRYAHVGVGNFDESPELEVVEVASGFVRMYSHVGELIWESQRASRRFGGAPTIGDVNGDGVPEIGVAGDRYYWLFNADGSVRWQQPIADSSEQTGSTFFDFDGDNRVEAVYMDEQYLRVFDGDTGEVVFKIKNRSVTAYEYPVVADVDGDDHAEIVVPQFDRAAGIRVFEDENDSWVNVRGIWNQYSYHVTNVEDDGSIARYAAIGPEHNAFRVNSVPDPTRVADLTASLFRLVDNGPAQALRATARIGNGGGRDARSVRVIIRSEGNVWAETIIPVLRAGEFMDVELQGLDLPAAPLDLVLEVNADGATAECFAHNNTATQPTIPTLGNVIVQSDLPEYTPEQGATFTAVVENTGTFSRAYSAGLSVRDAQGDVVVAFPVRALGELAPGAQHVMSEAWNTGRILGDDYYVLAELFDAANGRIGESTAAFRIAHDAQSGPLAELRLSTDRPRYHTTDRVRFDLLAQNKSLSTLLQASTLRVSVTQPNGEPAIDETLSVRELTPSSNVVLAPMQILDRAPLGDYEVTAVWRDATGALLAAAQSEFEVHEDLALSLQGSVTVAMPELHVGEAQLCTETATNTGTQSASVQFRHTLARLDHPGATLGTPFLATLTSGEEQSWVHSVQTAGMSEGDYACILQAKFNGEWNTLGNAFFRLLPPPIRIVPTMNAGTRGRLLVLLDPACANLDPAEAEGGACDADPHGPDFAAPLPVQREHIEAVLDAAGWRYTIVTNAADFGAAFNSKGYELYALFNEAVKLPEALQRDVVADIAAGRGLLVAGNHDRRNGRLEEALGIKSLGKNLEVEALVIEPFGEHEGGELAFDVAHWPNTTTLEGAEVVGEFRVRQKGKKAAAPEPALTRHAHDNGTGAYASFDWPAQSATQGDDGELAGLLVATLDVTHPNPYAAIAGRTFALHVSLQNEGMATPGQVHIVLPEGVSLVEGPPGAVVTNGIVAWSFTLSEEQQRNDTLWLKLPEASGPLTLEAVIYAGEGDGLTEHVRTQTVLNVQPQE